jgi:flagellin
MARINSNISSLIAQHNLAKSNADLQVHLQRLSTGLRINTGSDDPAGLIISERLKSEVASVGQAIDNAERATSVLGTGEAALAEVANLLNSIKSLTVQAANSGALSKEEIDANQLQIDSAVDSITRIAGTTSFAGLKLLNGSLDYLTSGIAASAISDASISSVNFGTGSTLPVTVQVLGSAQKAALFLSTATTTLPSALTLEVTGNKGVETLQFASGTSLSAVAFAINHVTDSTGVIASVVSGAAAGLSALKFSSAAFGSDAFVSVKTVPGTGGTFFKTVDAIGTGSSKSRDTGADVLALVNGSLALGQGTDLKLNTSTLKVQLTLTTAFAQTTNAAGNTKTFTITGGGANFQLGAEVQSSQQVSVGIQSVNANRLGDSVVGFLNSIVSGGANSLTTGRAGQAGLIIDKALTQVSVTRGRIGAFEKNTLQTNVNSLQISLENLTAAGSQVRDTDTANEVSALSRSQILNSLGTTVLSQANSAAQSVLRLLQ